jgi:hypothetical protein
VTVLQIVRFLAARPTLTYVIGSLLASFLIAYRDERKRVQKIIADTVRDLTERADEIEGRIARAKVGEEFAAFDADRWQDVGDIPARLAGSAPIER